MRTFALRVVCVLAVVAGVVFAAGRGATKPAPKTSPSSSPVVVPKRSALPPLPKPPPPPVRPRLLGNTTRTLQLKDPAGHAVVVKLTADRALDKRVLDYLAKTAAIVANNLSAADQATWKRNPGAGLGWDINVTITSPEGLDVSKYLLRPPPGFDQFRPGVLRPYAELLAGLKAHPSARFPEVITSAQSSNPGTSATFTLLGSVTCKDPTGAAGTGTPIADMEVSVDGVNGAWSSGALSFTGPIRIGTRTARVRYAGTLTANGASSRLTIQSDDLWPRFEDVNVTITAGQTTITIELKSTDCETWRLAHKALTDYLNVVGKAPPAGSLTLRRQGGVWVTPGITPAPYTYYETIILPTQWIEIFKNTSISPEHVIFHEFGHSIQHVADGDFAHWGLDLGNYSYARTRGTFCETFNRAFAFNEGWAQFWAHQRMNTTPSSCPEKAKVPAMVDWTELMIAARLLDLSKDLPTTATDSAGQRAERAKMMQAVLSGSPTKIHTLRDFEVRYCALHQNVTKHCADASTPTRAKPATCPPGFLDSTVNHCHLNNVIEKKRQSRKIIGPPTGCESGFEWIAGLCYSACPSGYSSGGPLCFQDCPAGWRNDGAYCAKPAPYSRGPGYGWEFGDAAFDLTGAKNRCVAANSALGCEQWGGIFYPKCVADFHAVGCCVCSPDCPKDMFDIGVSCQKQTAGRTISAPSACPAGSEYDAGLCYEKCPKDFVGVGAMCWQEKCEPGWVDTGTTCNQPPYVVLKV
jgi:hypothetical protein